MHKSNFKQQKKRKTFLIFSIDRYYISKHSIAILKIDCFLRMKKQRTLSPISHIIWSINPAHKYDLSWPLTPHGESFMKKLCVFSMASKLAFPRPLNSSLSSLRVYVKKSYTRIFFKTDNRTMYVRYRSGHLLCHFRFWQFWFWHF